MWIKSIYNYKTKMFNLTVYLQTAVILLLLVSFVRSENNASVVLNANSPSSGENSTGNHTTSPTSRHGHGGGIHVAAVAYNEVRDPLIFTIVVLLAALSKIGYHHANFLSSIVPESCILIVLGTLFGAVIHFSGISTSLPTFFKPHEFFIFLLPPIILEAAFSLHDRTFTENIGSILLFAVVGTVLACLMLGGTLYGLAAVGAMGPISDISFLQIMVFSSLIVAVDPVAVLAVFNEIGVNHVLYFLVFGESLLNDGVTVVLYKVFQAYNNMDEINGLHIFLGLVKFFVVCLGGLLIGVLAGIATALLTKHAQHVKVAQPLIIYTMAYFGFLMAELFEFSGIISIIGCGLVQMQYAFHNISDKSRTTLKYFTKVISSANEIIIFLFLGLVMVNDEHEWHTGFTLWTIFFCLIYRFIIIFSMTYMINWLDIYRVRKIGLQEQFMIAYGGLRGAVCFSLVALLNKDEIPCKNMFVTTTLSVIIFTVFVQGITIKPLVRFLQISLAPEKNQTMYKELNSRVCDHMMAGIEEIIGDHGRNHLRERLEYLDIRYLKPLLQIDVDPRDSNLKMFYENLLLKEHYKYLKLSGAKTDDEIPDLWLRRMKGRGNIPRRLSKLDLISSPHVNTELFLASLAISGHHPRLDLPFRERITSDSMSKPKSKSVPSTPGITIEMEPITMRKKNLFRSKSMGEKSTEIDARTLRSLLFSTRSSRMAFSRYDKNLTGQDDMHSEIRKKTNKNRRLEKIFSLIENDSPSVRRKSWSDTDAQMCEQRGQGRKALPRHAMTVDFGNTGPEGHLSPGSGDGTLTPSSPGWTLDSVFEEDEGETQPMMDGAKMTRSSSRSSSKRRLERQMGLDTPGAGDADSASTSDDTKALTDSGDTSGKSDLPKKKGGRLERGASLPTDSRGETRI